MRIELRDSTAIVTGAASGIGLAVAEAFAGAGARVVVSDIDEERGRAAAERLAAGDDRAIFVRADVSKPEECERLVRATVERFGRLDFACNNAGIGGESNRTADYSIDGWQKVIAINLSSVFYCMKYQVPAMLEAGGGAIVNMASILGQAGFASSPAYVAAKHGVVGLTRTAALEYATDGIRVNAVGPGFISTPLISEFEEDQEANRMLISLHPMGRLGRVEEIAGLVVFLCSEHASFTTGAYYAVDGGYLAR